MLKHWNQVSELELLHRGLSSLFCRPPSLGPESQQEALSVPEWAPLVDISEDDQQYLIKAELPEIRRENVKVVVADGTLTISGEREFEKEEERRKHHCVERAYGSFGRSFSLPDDANPATVTAELKDGVLKVHLAKTGKPSPQHIEVRVA